MSGAFAKSTGMARTASRPVRSASMGPLAQTCLPFGRRPCVAYPLVRFDSPDCQPIKLRGHRAR